MSKKCKNKLNNIWKKMALFNFSDENFQFPIFQTLENILNPKLFSCLAFFSMKIDRNRYYTFATDKN